jgi:hypothetical protein
MTAQRLLGVAAVFQVENLIPVMGNTLLEGNRLESCLPLAIIPVVSRDLTRKATTTIAMMRSLWDVMFRGYRTH